MKDIIIQSRVIHNAILLFLKGKGDWMALVDVPVGGVVYPTKRVARHVLIWVAILARLGKTTSCFARGILLCRTLRQCGVDARITFGADPQECRGEHVVRRIRHCWVEEVGDTAGEWLPVFKFP